LFEVFTTRDLLGGLNASDWVAFLIALVSFVAMIAYRRSARIAKSEIARSAREAADARETLASVQQCLESLLDNPPIPADSQLANHLSELGERVAALALELKSLQDACGQPLQWVRKEAQQSRTVSRQERFAKYRSALELANQTLSLHIDRIASVELSIVTLREALHCGHCNPQTGKAEIATITEVLDAVSKEVSIDDVRFSRSKEFEQLKKVQDRIQEIDRKQREEQRAAALQNFSARRPQSAAEKFKLIASKGQRDSFG
jgi:hypothetical protein